MKPVVINVAKEGQSLLAYQVGVIDGISKQGMPLQVQDVKVVGGLRENLISVSKLTKAGIEVSFGKQISTLKKNGQVIATAYLQGDYKLEIEKFPVVAKASTSLRREERLVIPIFFNQEGEKLELHIPEDGEEDVHAGELDDDAVETPMKIIAEKV